MINMLTKVSNSPILLKATVDKAKAKESVTGARTKRAAAEDAVKLLPERAQIEDMGLSGSQQFLPVYMTSQVFSL